MLQSITSFNKTGLPRSVLLHCLSSLPEFPSLYSDCLSFYKKFFWQNQYILANSKGGIILKDNKEFIVVFKKPRGQILAKPNEQSALSFRAALPEFNVPNYVIIY